LWPAVFTSWFFSFLGSWSIGIYTLSLTFVLTALALSLLAGLHRPFHLVGAVAVGFVAWAVLHRVLDDYWLFWPFHVTLTPLLSS
jgi:hypothetical protein